MRLASEQHWSQIRRQLENLQEQCENQSLSRLPKPLPISRTNLLRLEPPEDHAFGIKRLLHTTTATLRSDAPSMQLSSDYSASLDRPETYVSAVEYHSAASGKAMSTYLPSSAAIRPFQRLLFDNARAIAIPEVTTFHARTRSSHWWRRRPWMAPHVTMTSHATPDALLSLQRRLDDRGYSLLQTESGRQYREEHLNNHIVHGFVKNVGRKMLPVFAEDPATGITDKKTIESRGIRQVTGISVRWKRHIPSGGDHDQLESIRAGIQLRKHSNKSPRYGKVTIPFDDSMLGIFPGIMSGIVLLNCTIGADPAESQIHADTWVLSK